MIIMKMYGVLIVSVVVVIISLVIIKLTLKQGKENAKMANAALAIDLKRVELFISHCEANKDNEESISIMLMLLSKIPGVGKEYLQVLNSNYRRKFNTIRWSDLEDFNGPLTEPLKL